MKRRTSVLILAMVVFATGPASGDATTSDAGTTLVSVIAGLVPLIPGPHERIERLFHARSTAPTRDWRGWHHQPITYRVSDGTLLHIQLISDWENVKTADVVRVVAAVDLGRCVNAAALRDALADAKPLHWQAVNGDQGWITSDRGKFITINASGQCVLSLIVDTRRQPRVGPPVRALRVDPAGRIMRVPAPGH